MKRRISKGHNLFCGSSEIWQQRTISACAEPPLDLLLWPVRCGDYLRVCGATSTEGERGEKAVGLSPRVRSHLNRRVASISGTRAISACAEPPRAQKQTCRGEGGYLRVCGATHCLLLRLLKTLGLSPRVRSHRRCAQAQDAEMRAISACAEPPLCRYDTFHVLIVVANRR